jgi:hypothetical protein
MWPTKPKIDYVVFSEKVCQPLSQINKQNKTKQKPGDFFQEQGPIHVL